MNQPIDPQYVIETRDLAIYSSGNITCSDEVVLNGHLYALSGEIDMTGFEISVAVPNVSVPDPVIK